MGARRVGPSPPLLPDRLRRPASVAAGTAAGLFVVLSLAFAGDSAASQLDATAARVGMDLAAFGRVFAAITTLGNPVPVALVAAALAALSLALRRRRLAVLAVTAPLVSGFLTVVIKPVIGRTRGDDFAFPSGHATGLMALCLVATLVVIGFARAHLLLVATLTTSGALVAMITIGLAVTTRGGHYWTDTVGSCCLAVAVVLGMALLLDRWPGPVQRAEGAPRRRRSRRPAERPAVSRS